MDLSYSAEDELYRVEVKAFLSATWDPANAKSAGYVERFRGLATERGYLYRAYPKRYGGSEQPPNVIRARIIAEAFAAAGAPQEITGIGMMMLAPTLLEVGTDWQRDKFIPNTLTGAYRWAQGYSEPGAGSDLASLKSKAELVGDEWVINGQKIWTTRAQEANFMFALLRTEPQAPKHEGLSYILLDFKQPGITVRPIKQIDGGQEFCEVFLDDVRTPADWIVGQRGQGWAISRVNLKHERNSVGSSARVMPQFESLVKMARRVKINGKSGLDDPGIRSRLAAVHGRILAQLWSGYYQTTLLSQDEDVGLIGLVNKITTSNIGQEIAGIAADLIGDDALLAPPRNGRGSGNERWVNQILGSLGLSIAGGTSNIQRNIVSERGLKLPRDQTESRA